MFSTLPFTAWRWLLLFPLAIPLRADELHPPHHRPPHLSGVEVVLDREAVRLAAIETRPIPAPQHPPGRRFLVVVLDPQSYLPKWRELLALRREKRLLRELFGRLQAYRRRLDQLGRAVPEPRRYRLERELFQIGRRLIDLRRREEGRLEELRRRYGSTELSPERLLVQVAIDKPLPLRIHGKIPITPLGPAHYRHPLLPQAGFLYLLDASRPLPYETPLWAYAETAEAAHPLPREAVFLYAGQRWIFRRIAPGRFRLQRVEVVREEGRRVWVRAPLQGEVVVRGGLFLLGELLKGLIPGGEEE